MKQYERNKELFTSFIQGWYMPDDVISDILKTTESFDDSGKLMYTNDRLGYSGMNLVLLPEKTQKSYLNFLNKIVLLYENKYPFLENLNYKLFKNINIQYWKPEKYFADWHYEISNGPEKIYRNLVFMTYLNNISSGGETEFFYQNCKIKPKKGLTIVWPANWTHTHRGCITREKKYAITGWFELITEKPNLHLEIPNRADFGVYIPNCDENAFKFS